MSVPNPIAGYQVGTQIGVIPLYQPKDKWTESTGNGSGSCERTFRAFYATWRDICPALYSLHPESPLYYLKTRVAEQLQTNGFLCDVTLTYVLGINATIPGLLIPPDLVDENDNRVEIPIERHPLFNDDDYFPTADKIFDPTTKQFLGFVATSPYFGESKFITGSCTVSITQYAESPFASVVDQIGFTSDPGHGLGSPGQWLLASGHRGKQGVFYTLTTTYEFSSVLWPAIYSTYPDTE